MLPGLPAGLLVEAVDHVGVGPPGVAQVVQGEAQSEGPEGGIIMRERERERTAWSLPTAIRSTSTTTRLLRCLGLGFAPARLWSAEASLGCGIVVSSLRLVVARLVVPVVSSL